MRIRAAVLRKPGTAFSLEEVEVSGINDSEVMVGIIAAGVCRTDIDLAEGAARADLPCILGHEGAGIVTATGRAVKRLKPGDHVVLSYASCGACRNCRSGKPYQCVAFWKLNFQFTRQRGQSAYAQAGIHGHFFAQSSFATCAVATERNCIKVPRTLPLPMLAPLGCGVQTGAGTVMNIFRMRPRQSLIVLGAGSVGLSAIMAAKILKAAPIVAIDKEPHRLKLARELGAHFVLQGKNVSVKQLSSLLGADADYAIDTSSSPRLRQLADKLLSPRGALAILSGEEVPQGRNWISVIQGSSDPQKFIPWLIRRYKSGQLPLERFISLYPFHGINQAMEDVKKGRTIKAVLCMAP